MQMLRSLRKKKNLRRLAAFWLFLLVIEFFCPVFGDGESIIAANLDASRCTAVSTVKENDRSGGVSMTAGDPDHQSHEQAVCHDECLCHATAIPSINIINHDKAIISRESIAFRYGDPLFNSLPPPFQPPKRS